jgi:hypothetical protein
MDIEQKNEELVARMNDKQKASVDQLLSELDNFKLAGEHKASKTFVFDGDSADGPAVGYINADGSVEYITGHHN